jgi:hypothetical protein
MAYAFTKRVGNPYDTNTWLSEWAELSNSQTDPEYISVPNHTDVTVQVRSIDSGSPTVIVEGSLDLDDQASKVWFPLTRAAGTAVSFTSAGGMEVLQSCMLIRPRVSSGTGAATVRLKATRTYPGH